MIEKIRRYMEEQHMAEPGSRIVVGVSGGADSICLLHVLALLAPSFQWKLAAVHVNHLIREEAGDDASYVEETCGQLGISFYLTQEDVEALAKAGGLSVEEAGRQVRYRAFYEAAESFGADRIAVAHNRNDRAETLLFHMFRGTGLDGMASIRPVRDKIIRPLLCVGREEIEQWLLEKNIRWCIDKSNDTDTYTRNKIRRHILPFAREEICTEADVHLAQEAELLALTADFVGRRAQEALDRCRLSEKAADGSGSPEPLAGKGDLHSAASRIKRIRIAVPAFLQEEKLLQTHLLKLVLRELSEGGKDIGMSHIRDVESLFYKQGGKKVMLPYGLEALRSFGEVIVQERKPVPEALEGTEGEAPAAEFFINIDMEELAGNMGDAQNAAPVLALAGKEGRILEFSLFPWENSQIIPQKTCTKWFDYDRIESLVLRTRQPGDYLCINDKLQKKRLKDYLIQEKIPVQERENLLLLADGSHILWVVGHRISSAVKVTDSTKRVLRVHIRGGKENG
ncbi:tRNA lysidine(34) synthetase TilS [Eisenbergiella sp.]